MTSRARWVPWRHAFSIGSSLLLDVGLRFRRTVAFLAIEAQLFAQDIFERELGVLALASQVAVDLVAFLASA